jgi:hypothetical protein
LKGRLAQIPNVKSDPAPDVETIEFSTWRALSWRSVPTATPIYWQVYFDTNRAIREGFGSAGFPVPEQHLALRNGASVGLSSHEGPKPAKNHRSVHGQDPFTGGSPANHVFFLQMFLITVSMPVIFLATVIEERRRTEQTGPGRSHRRVILDILHQTNWRIEGPKGAALILESTPIRCARV